MRQHEPTWSLYRQRHDYAGFCKLSKCVLTCNKTQVVKRAAQQQQLDSTKHDSELLWHRLDKSETIVPHRWRPRSVTSMFLFFGERLSFQISWLQHCPHAAEHFSSVKDFLVRLRKDDILGPVCKHSNTQTCSVTCIWLSDITIMGGGGTLFLSRLIWFQSFLQIRFSNVRFIYLIQTVTVDERLARLSHRFEVLSCSLAWNWHALWFSSSHNPERNLEG